MPETPKRRFWSYLATLKALLSLLLVLVGAIRA